MEESVQAAAAAASSSYAAAEVEAETRNSLRQIRRETQAALAAIQEQCNLAFTQLSQISGHQQQQEQRQQVPMPQCQPQLPQHQAQAPGWTVAPSQPIGQAVFQPEILDQSGQGAFLAGAAAAPGIQQQDPAPQPVFQAAAAPHYAGTTFYNVQQQQAHPAPLPIVEPQQQGHLVTIPLTAAPPMQQQQQQQQGCYGGALPLQQQFLSRPQG